MKHRPLVFLDIETTGGSARSSRITEIGALRIEDNKIVGKFKQLVNPEERVPRFITGLTGITDEMLWDAPVFKGIADDLELFLDGALFIAHNVGFDYSFIKMEFERIGYKFNMDRACSERMGLDVESRHRAYDDAEVIWKFYQAELKQRELELFNALNKVTHFARV